MFDEQHVAQLRADCLNHAIDTSRATITVDAGKYVVKFGAPLFSLGDVLPNPPINTTVAGKLYAEGVFLQGLLRLQVAERHRARFGRVIGWSNDQLNRKPLSDDEIADFKAELANRTEGAKLQAELAEVLVRNEQAKKARLGATDLAERYGAGLGAAVDVPAKKRNTSTRSKV